MGDPTRIRIAERQALRRTQRTARQELPGDWLPIIDAEARQAAPDYARFAIGAPSAQRDVWRRWLGEFGGAAASQLSDSQIKARAHAYALEARSIDIGEWAESRPWHEFARLVEFCRSREVEPPAVAFLLRGMSARVRCPYWWRRALRRMVARKCERGALSLGLVSKPRGTPYASDQALMRRIAQNERNARVMQFTVMENDEGYRRTLAELAAVAVSNKAIRRGELMTRIRGCEAIADECGYPGLFLTLTCPSRFHSTLRDGRRNPKHDGSTPRDAQEWLCKRFELARSKLHRKGIRMFGFRVAEPHHDGCTHWHALLWFESRESLHAARRIIRDYWLRDAGDEPGAQRYRVNSKKMIPGRASGYVAKYVSKNIDDHAITSHLDDYAEGEIAPDLLGDLEIKPSQRVEAWAATWGIRQFQPLGQPPVTVWRELRRVREDEARRAGFNGTIHKAWLAAQKVAGVLADWARYVKAQGGMMLGRACRIVMRHDVREVEGLYGRTERPVPIGVALNDPCARTVWSERRLWRVIDVQDEAADEGAKAPRSGAPRTRVNNCTQAVDAADDADADALRADFLRGVGGATFEGYPHETDRPTGLGPPGHQGIQLPQSPVAASRLP